ncbi:MAG TPA: hypothetical protein EYG78_06865 [Sulfurovum sp.]|nr:hypothetical protein [Sulfurovum sp.]
MTKIAIEYNEDKDLMLAEAITRAANMTDLNGIIWLVWTDHNNLRGHFFHNKMNVLSETDKKTLLNGERLDYGSYYLRSISREKTSAIRPGDIAIDCFTGGLYGAVDFRASALLHLPGSKHENDLLQKY